MTQQRSSQTGGNDVLLFFMQYTDCLDMCGYVRYGWIWKYVFTSSMVTNRQSDIGLNIFYFINGKGLGKAKMLQKPYPNNMILHLL